MECDIFICRIVMVATMGAHAMIMASSGPIVHPGAAFKEAALQFCIS